MKCFEVKTFTIGPLRLQHQHLFLVPLHEYTCFLFFGVSVLDFVWNDTISLRSQSFNVSEKLKGKEEEEGAIIYLSLGFVSYLEDTILTLYCLDISIYPNAFCNKLNV